VTIAGTVPLGFLPGLPFGLVAVPVAAAGSPLGDAVPWAAGAFCTVPSSLLVLI